MICFVCGDRLNNHGGIIPGKTLVVFDEIQDCPRAIQSLKYFCEILQELHLIAAGSLLGVALRKEGISFPVGKVDRLEMYPMSFEEFVIADGGEKYIQGLKKLAFEREIPELYTVPLVMTQLKCMGIDSYFWRTKAEAEIDFISDYEGVLLPIEMKRVTNDEETQIFNFIF
ncbi:MAG: AAA family ATPase [Anaerovoracaceae bacterium]